MVGVEERRERSDPLVSGDEPRDADWPCDFLTLSSTSMLSGPSCCSVRVRADLNVYETPDCLSLAEEMRLKDILHLKYHVERDWFGDGFVLFIRSSLHMCSLGPTVLMRAERICSGTVPYLTINESYKCTHSPPRPLTHVGAK